MAYSEIREAFLSGDASAKELKQFHFARKFEIAAGDIPSPLKGPFFVLHLLPMTLSARYDALSLRSTIRDSMLLCPFENSGYSFHISMEGLVTYDSASVTTFRRDGAVEAVADSPFIPGGNLIASEHLEEHLISAVGRYIKVMGALGVPAPCTAIFGMVGVRGAIGWQSRRAFSAARCPLQKMI